jgi:hypothetical protein
VDERIDKGLELLVVWLLLVSAVGLLSTLAGHFLAPQVLLASLVFACIYAWYTNGSTLAALGVSPDWRHLLLLSLLCMLFRLPAYNYVLGGQDEGIYVNVAQAIERTGTIDVNDMVLEKLKGSPFVGTYLAENRVEYAKYLPGIYSPDPVGTKLEFQFYHLFPVWMALFSGVFGSTFGIYALSFFAWLSVLFFYRLALVISRSRNVALLAGLFLALNPLHVFFSKFPVTEVPTLAFSLVGFTYLAAFWNKAGVASSYRWLWISGASFAALFATRISGFMYVPFFIALAIASTIIDTHRERRDAILTWAISVVALYALSVFYGFYFSSQYAGDIYRMSFEPILHSEWRVGVTAIVLIVFVAWAALTWIARSDGVRVRMRRYLVMPLRQAVGTLVVLSLAVGLFKIYRLGWTDHYIHDYWLGDMWGLAHSGTQAVKSSSLFELAVYLGPLLPACFLAFVVRRQDNPQIEFLRLFVSGFFVYVALLQWIIPYGPYYARYLLSELVPYLTLFVVLAWSCMAPAPWKKVIKSMLAISLVYMTIASAQQLGKSETAGIYAALQQLLAPADSSDLVLIDSSQSAFPTESQIKTSMLYTFGRSAVSVSEKSLGDRAYLATLNALYDDTFLVSENAMVPAEFEPLGSTRVKFWSFAPSHWYPSKLMLRGEKRLYLFILTKPVLPFAQVQKFDQSGSWNGLLASGWSGPESWGTWSLGKHAELIIDTRQLPDVTNGLHLHFDANAFVTPSHPQQRIVVSLNGTVVGNYEATYPSPAVGIDLDIPQSSLTSPGKIRVGFAFPDAASPQSAGAGADERTLALGLEAITITQSGSDQPKVPDNRNPSIQKRLP